MILLRALARLLRLAWMIVLAAAALALVAYCIDGVVGLGSGRPDRLLHLPSVRLHVGHALRRLGEPGPVAALGLAGGIAAMIVALALLLGLLAPRRPRLVTISDGDDGTVAARPRAVSDLLRDRARSVSEVVRVARPRVRPGRLATRARVTVVPSAAAEGDAGSVRRSVGEALADVADPLGVRVRVRARVARGRS